MIFIVVYCPTSGTETQGLTVLGEVITGGGVENPFVEGDFHPEPLPPERVERTLHVLTSTMIHGEHFTVETDTAKITGQML